MKNPYIQKITFLIVFFFIVIVLFKIILPMIIAGNDLDKINIIQGVFKLILFVVTIYLLYQEKGINLNFAFKNNLLCFSLSALFIYLSISHTFNEIKEHKFHVSNLAHFSHLFQCMSTGFFEEFFFRLLLFSFVCFIFKSSERKNYYKEAIITSALFAIVHLSNLFNNDYDVIGVFIQITFAFLIGLLLQSIFYKTKNIILVVIIHGLINYSGTLNHKLFHTRDLSTDTSRLEDLFQSFLTFAIFGIVIVFPIAFFFLRSRNNYLINQTSI